MRFSFNALALLAALGAAACSAGDVLPAGSTSSIPPEDKTGTSLYFEDEGTLTLTPGEVRSIAVRSSGAGAFEVAFSLLGNVGDAFVEASLVPSDAQGVAKVVLHAPNQATTFTVRAAIVDAEGRVGSGAELSVAVSDEGFGAVRVLPQYTGKRAIETWTASVVARTTCADLAGVLPGEPAGSLVATASPSGAPLIESAPVGPNLAVTLRAGHYAWGCTDLSTLSAGSTLDVKVTIFDEPVVLSATNLDLSLEFQPDPVELQPLVDDASYLLREGFAQSAKSEATVLLDAMAAGLDPAGLEAFNKQRQAQGWDELASDHFADHEVDLRARIGAWVIAGLPLPAPTLTANLRAIEGAKDQATLEVTSLGGLSAKDAGIPEKSTFAWTADPSDSLSLNGVLLWQPSRLVGTLALTGALQEVEDATSVPEALAEVADCDDLAISLGAFASCETECLAQLCRDALAQRWASALSASTDAGLLGHIVINAAGPATLDDLARPVGFHGVWIGSIGDNLLTVETKGAISGEPPSVTPPP